ncbi:hypothetical protein ACFY1B_49260 [Streptomyces mirabilis]|uniref:hypothetical protein n=1 Tax=Streptomyces mirabilis TaxID=68239 RepID=UPI0036C3F51B
MDSTGHGPRIAQLAALLYFRPGRSADVLCADMDPVSPWSVSTLNARLQGLRRSLGSDPAGHPYVPRRKSGEDLYRLSPGVRRDWTRFLQLAERALPPGPAGLPGLERALALVRGRPFGGRPLPWAEPYQQEMITRITDVAHTVAIYRTPAGPTTTSARPGRPSRPVSTWTTRQSCCTGTGCESSTPPETDRASTPPSPASNRSTALWTAH